MRTHTKLAVIPGFALGLALLGAWLAGIVGNHVPTVQGHSLGFWTEMCGRSNVFPLLPSYGKPTVVPQGFYSSPRATGFDPSLGDPKLDLVLRSLDSNSAPFLVRWAGYQPLPWIEKITEVRDKRQNRLAAWIPDWLTDDREMDRAEGAMAFLQWLGPEAWPVIPELKAMALTTNLERAQFATATLRTIGPAALSTLISIITNRSVLMPTRVEALEVLGSFGDTAAPALPLLTNTLQDPHLLSRALPWIGGLGPKAKPAVPILVSALGTDDPSICPIIETLGQIAIEPEVTVPALTNCLNSTNTLVEFYAAMYLGHFGKEARSALAALTNVAMESESLMHWAATNSIQAIGN